MVKLRAEVLMNTPMVPSMSVTGKRTNSMDMVFKHGQMELNMRVITSLAKNMALEPINGLTDQLILENFIIIIYMVKVFKHGVATESMKVNGV